MDTEACVNQALECHEAGCDLFRYTVQGEREAQNLSLITSQLRRRECAIPLVADIHFNRKPAFESLKYVEKVRINPGNFADSRKDPEKTTIDKIRQEFGAFLQEATNHQRAVRIGVNHGSLSARILEQYGNTPQGMVESCLEYLGICREHSFDNIIISMKSSNVRVMTEAVRKLIVAMDSLGVAYPLHLGVTEAGSGEDGRIKSSIGIGSLLMDGIGDTIRVSLSEDPICEIVFGRKLIEYVESVQTALQISDLEACPADRYTEWNRKQTALSYNALLGQETTPIVFLPTQEPAIATLEGVHPIASTRYTEIDLDQDPLLQQTLLPSSQEEPIMLTSQSPLALYRWRKAYEALQAKGAQHPTILHFKSSALDADKVLIEACLHLGSALLQGMGNAVMLTAEHLAPQATADLLLSILQAARIRSSRTEFISCPGCGRTLFDLQSVVQEIKKELSHLPNLKIGIMGCIVNGPGEMSDSDYGFVGGAVGKVDLYKKQECIRRGIPKEEALPILIEIIRQNGDWKEPPTK